MKKLAKARKIIFISLGITALSTVAIAIPIAVSNHIQTTTNNKYYNYQNTQILSNADFKRINNPITEYFNLTIPNYNFNQNKIQRQASPAVQTVSSNDQKISNGNTNNSTIAQNTSNINKESANSQSSINKQPNKLQTFLAENKSTMVEIYKMVYKNAIDSTGQASAQTVTNNYKQLPSNLKNFAKTFISKFSSLNQNSKRNTVVNTKQQLTNSSNKSADLWADEWYWFDLNVYYIPNNVLPYVNFLQEQVQPYLNNTSNLGSIIEDAGKDILNTGNEYLDVISTVLDIFGNLLSIAPDIGNQIVGSILQTMYSAYQNDEGATTHWLFDFIYVGISVGNNEWWGA